MMEQEASSEKSEEKEELSYEDGEIKEVDSPLSDISDAELAAELGGKISCFQTSQEEINSVSSSPVSPDGKNYSLGKFDKCMSVSHQKINYCINDFSIKNTDAYTKNPLWKKLLDGSEKTQNAPDEHGVLDEDVGRPEGGEKCEWTVDSPEKTGDVVVDSDMESLLSWISDNAEEEGTPDGDGSVPEYEPITPEKSDDEKAAANSLLVERRLALEEEDEDVLYLRLMALKSVSCDEKDQNSCTENLNNEKVSEDDIDKDLGLFINSLKIEQNATFLKCASDTPENLIDPVGKPETGKLMLRPIHLLKKGPTETMQQRDEDRSSADDEVVFVGSTLNSEVSMKPTKPRASPDIICLSDEDATGKSSNVRVSDKPEKACPDLQTSLIPLPPTSSNSEVAEDASVADNGLSSAKAFKQSKTKQLKNPPLPPLPPPPNYPMFGIPSDGITYDPSFVNSMHVSMGYMYPYNSYGYPYYYDHHAYQNPSVLPMRESLEPDPNLDRDVEMDLESDEENRSRFIDAYFESDDYIARQNFSSSIWDMKEARQHKDQEAIGARATEEHYEEFLSRVVSGNKKGSRSSDENSSASTEEQEDLDLLRANLLQSLAQNKQKNQLNPVQKPSVKDNNNDTTNQSNNSKSLDKEKGRTSSGTSKITDLRGSTTMSKSEPQNISKYFPNLKKSFVFDLSQDSDNSDNELELSRKMKKDANSSNFQFESIVDSFLKTARNNCAGTSVKKQVQAKRNRSNLKMRQNMIKSIKTLSVSDKQILMNSSVNHLSLEKQKEYRHLKQLIARKEAEKRHKSSKIKKKLIKEHGSSGTYSAERNSSGVAVSDGPKVEEDSELNQMREMLLQKMKSFQKKTSRTGPGIRESRVGTTGLGDRGPLPPIKVKVDAGSDTRQVVLHKADSAKSNGKSEGKNKVKLQKLAIAKRRSMQNKVKRELNNLAPDDTSTCGTKLNTEKASTVVTLVSVSNIPSSDSISSSNNFSDSTVKQKTVPIVVMTKRRLTEVKNHVAPKVSKLTPKSRRRKLVKVKSNLDFLSKLIHQYDKNLAEQKKLGSKIINLKKLLEMSEKQLQIKKSVALKLKTNIDKLKFQATKPLYEAFDGKNVNGAKSALGRDIPKNGPQTKTAKNSFSRTEVGEKVDSTIKEESGDMGGFSSRSCGQEACLPKPMIKRDSQKISPDLERIYSPCHVVLKKLPEIDLQDKVEVGGGRSAFKYKNSMTILTLQKVGENPSDTVINIEDSFESPLLHLRSQSGKLSERLLNPNLEFCRFSLLGKCNDEACQYQH